MSRKIPKGQINRKNKQTIQALTQLMKDLDQKFSIRVGIIGDKAYEKHKTKDKDGKVIESGLTNAQLGSIHEFGATIKVTPKMRAYLHHIGVHLKPETTTITIPTRSFLRMPLLSGEFKEYLLYGAREVILKGLKSDYISYEGLKAKPEIMEGVCEWIGAEALARVQAAFQTGGFGNWAPISEITKIQRIGDANNPPLDDTGDLKDSITVEVKKVK